MANRNVSCGITLFKPKIRKLEKAQEEALSKTAGALMTEVQNSEKMPFDIGTLHDSTFVDRTEMEEGTVYIVSDTPYARRLYYHPEYHFSKKEHSKAGGRWLDDYLPGGKKQDFAQKTFNALYKKLAGV